jgi:arylsulfatase A-like enzyme
MSAARLTSLVGFLFFLVFYCHDTFASENVNFRMNGAWYDPSHDGEGFLVEVLEDERSLVYWFTYDSSGNQRWFVGTGIVSGDRIDVEELLAGSEAKFGGAFDPEDVVLRDAGSLSLNWSDCDQAGARYVVDGIEGSQSLQRLTSLAGMGCSVTQAAGSPESGSWFDVTHQGEGLVIEVLSESQALVFWFSYDPQGNPAWFFGVGEFSDEHIAVTEMFTSRGGLFGPDFDPMDIEILPWGSVLVELGCRFGKLDYAADMAGFGTGKQTLSRLSSPGNPDCQEAAPPNILLVIADDLGMDSSSQYAISEDLPVTPVLDELAAQGLIFDNAWSSPVCSPTRAGILTGKYGLRTGVLDAGDELATTETSLQSFIHQYLPGRYADAVIGKWHLGPGNRGIDHPADLGIGYFSGILGGGVEDYENWRLTTNGLQSTETTYSTSRLVDEASDWVDQQTTPWFLWLAFNAPHTPFHLPPAGLHDRDLSGTDTDISRNPRPYYLAAIEAMDTELGRLLQSMDEQTRSNTIIIFLGDNGTPGRVAQSPFTTEKAKGSLYQGGINVPMIVAGPGVSRAGERESALVNTTDLFATVASLAGVNVDKIHDSHSFAPLLNGTDPAERTLQYSEVTRDGLEGWSVSDGAFKLIEYTDGRQQLFGLELDPFENDELIESGVVPIEPWERLQDLVDQIRQ